jgi:hypothetical protein
VRTSCIIPIVIALLECSTGAYAISSSHEITAPPPTGRIRDIERLLGDKIPPDAAPRMLNIEHIAYVVRFEGQKYCNDRGVCLTYVISKIGPRPFNAAALLAKNKFVMYAEDSQVIRLAGVMIFEGDYGSVEVNLNDRFVCVVGGQAK